ncbi:MAG: bacteriohopanetetrol glucosamine biosynthesis glycosyltransferase HpnI [Acidobacteriia bacterium]|nr:bacteriohopanetetrol glucosamine biosynthesis glycosyltransferase HpnI [Terriglobia bacterium]
MGSLVYSLLTVVAARNYLKTQPTPPPKVLPPISILTPLAGVDLGLEENLRSSFQQDYPEFEVVFAIRQADDPSVPVARRVMSAFPRVPSTLIVAGEPDCANAKVFSLARMTAVAQFDLLVMNDSDIRAPRNMLRTVAAEFQDAAVGLVTCPYRAIPGRSWPSKLEALLMNTQFLGGVLVARMLEGMKFALGPSLIVRRSALERIGGWTSLKDFLAEDFVIGKLISEAGHRVILSSCVVEHHIGSSGIASNLAHRIRWVRSTRRSRPKGYVGEIFTNPLPLALALWLVLPATWPLLVVTVVFRALSVAAIAGWVLRDSLCARLFWALPLQDILAFLIWVAGFFGNRITWRGRNYYLHRDGRFELIG